MNTWTFGRKLAVGFLAVAGLAVLLCAMSVVALRRVAAGDAASAEAAGRVVSAERLRSTALEHSGRVRAYLLTGSTDDRRLVDESAAALDTAIGALDLASFDADVRSAGVAIGTAGRHYRDVVEPVLGAGIAGVDPDAASRRFSDEVRPAYHGLDAAIDTLVAAVDTDARDARAAAERDRVMAERLLVALAIAVVLASIVGSIALTRSLTSQIGTTVQHMRSSSAELRTTAAQQASGAQEQATALTEISASVAELLASSRQIAQRAQHVSRTAVDTATAAREGDRAVDEAATSVADIQRQVEAIVQQMLELGRRSQQIGGVLEIIEELAEQTNILAINATIEAAGAGEAGRRFAVVSDEIRKLADRVSGSTKEVGALLDSVRAGVNGAVMATESGAKSVDASASRFRSMAATFRRIGDLVDSTADAAREIELSTTQQSAAVEQVNVGMSNLAQAARDAEVGTAQTAQTATELTTLSGDLSRLVLPAA